MNKFIKEKLKEFEDKYEGANTGGAISSKQMDGMIALISQALSSVYEQGAREGQEAGKQKTIKEYKPVLDDMHVTDWLRNRYGLSDDDILNAGEVEELLQYFVSDHKKKE